METRTPTQTSQRQHQQARVGWTAVKGMREGEIPPVVEADVVVAHMKTWKEIGPKYVDVSVATTQEKLAEAFGIVVSAEDALMLMDKADEKWYAKQRPPTTTTSGPPVDPTSASSPSSAASSMRARATSAQSSSQSPVEGDATPCPTPLPRVPSQQHPPSFLSRIRPGSLASRVMSIVGLGSSNSLHDEAAARLDECEEQLWRDGRRHYEGEEEDDDYEDYDEDEDDAEEDAIMNGVRPYIQRGGGFVKSDNARALTPAQEADVLSIEGKLSCLPAFGPQELRTLGELISTDRIGEDVILRLQAMHITMKMLKKAAHRQCTVVLPRCRIQNQLKKLHSLVAGGAADGDAITFVPYAIDTNSSLARDGEGGPPLMMEERTTLVIHIKW